MNGIDKLVLDESSSGDISTKSSRKEKSGFPSYPWLIIFILGGMAMSTVVGLIVHYAQPEKVCICPTDAPEIPETTTTTTAITPSTTTPLPTGEDYMWDLCLNISAARNECFPCNLPTEPTPVPTDPTVINYRLPQTLVPSHYDIDIRPHFYDINPDNFWFEGNVSIHLECVEATSYIYVHTLSMTVDRVLVYGVDNDESIIVRQTDYDEVTHFFRITLARTLTVNEEVIVSMSFNGGLFKDMYGLYYSDYEEGSDVKYMLVTQFQATSARKAFPCLDEPLYKATFNVSLQHRSHMVALNNMPNISYEVLEDDWVRTTFEKTPIEMSTYLQAFAISEYKYIDNYADSDLALSSKYIRYWAKPDSVDANHLDWAYNITPPLFDFLENYFDHPFDLPKTDQIAVSDFSAGAMENWGLITYTEVRLLNDPDYTPTTTVQRMTITIAHELLHMWLGNVVTCKWWSDLWTQEGMATFHQHEAVGYANPTWDMDDLFTTEVVYKALEYDGTGASHPLTNYAAQSPSEVSGMFTRVTYEKGGAVIRMCRDFMGKIPFDTGMRNYVQKMSFSNAVEADLFASWEEQAPPSLELSVGEILRSWTNQMGHPLVTFRKIRGTNQVEVTQKMFLIDPEAPLVEKYPASHGYTWHIPLTFQTSLDVGVTERDWLYREDKNITINNALQDDDWILGNIGHIGFYRVNYDNTTWRALISQLQNNHTVINRISRAQLIYDSFHLARSGDLDQKTGLDLIGYLTGEQEYLPFSSLVTSAAYLNGMISRYPQYTSYRTFINGLLTPSYTRLGWEAAAEEPLMTTFHRNLVIDTLCANDHTACTEEALRRFNLYMLTPTDMQIIHPDQRGTVYCTAVRIGGEQVWEWLLSKYYEEKDAHEKPLLRNSLSCTTQPWLLNRLFMMALEDTAMSSDRSAILSAIARNRNANSLVWENLHAMWENENFLTSRSSVLSVLSEFYSTPDEYALLVDFTTPRTDALQNSAESILRTVRANIRWMDRNSQDVLEFLDRL